MTEVTPWCQGAPRRAAVALAAVVFGALVSLTGCADTGGRRSGVVVTTNILGDITRNVVGGETGVTVLMKTDSDPHSFGISARQAAQIEDAALIVYNGLGLEEGVLRNVQAARDAGVPTLAVGDGVDPIRYTADDTAGQPDPHFWTDPRRVSRAVDLIAERVIEEVDGVDAAAIRANAVAYRGKLEELDAWMGKRFEVIPPDRRSLVTNHHVFGYFAERYDFEVIGAVIPSGTTLASPSAADLKSLADAIRRAKVTAVFADSAQPDRLAQVLASEAGLDVRVIELFSESLSKEGGASTYVEMMRSNTAAIVDGLGKR
ncbi:zinc ABC transporter substrate-binding protein AztC [Streptosporangium sp. NPDC006013]|uniref:zinc ABC transporter substrate-binding protein AztC n=1 Tax=Streptosporangium sp. NPDC006013 TaxID=3155596 RepID=UPI00339FE529